MGMAEEDFFSGSDDQSQDDTPQISRGAGEGRTTLALSAVNSAERLVHTLSPWVRESLTGEISARTQGSLVRRLMQKRRTDSFTFNGTLAIMRRFHRIVNRSVAWQVGVGSIDPNLFDRFSLDMSKRREIGANNIAELLKLNRQEESLDMPLAGAPESQSPAQSAPAQPSRPITMEEITKRVEAARQFRSQSSSGQPDFVEAMRKRAEAEASTAPARPQSAPPAAAQTPGLPPIAPPPSNLPPGALPPAANQPGAAAMSPRQRRRMGRKVEYLSIPSGDDESSESDGEPSPRSYFALGPPDPFPETTWSDDTPPFAQDLIFPESVDDSFLPDIEAESVRRRLVPVRRETSALPAPQRLPGVQLPLRRSSVRRRSPRSMPAQRRLGQPAASRPSIAARAFSQLTQSASGALLVSRPQSMLAHLARTVPVLQRSDQPLLDGSPLQTLGELLPERPQPSPNPLGALLPVAQQDFVFSQPLLQRFFGKIQTDEASMQPALTAAGPLRHPTLAPAGQARQAAVSTTPSPHRRYRPGDRRAVAPHLAALQSRPLHRLPTVAIRGSAATPAPMTRRAPGTTLTVQSSPASTIPLRTANLPVDSHRVARQGSASVTSIQAPSWPPAMSGSDDSAPSIRLRLPTVGQHTEPMIRRSTLTAASELWRPSLLTDGSPSSPAGLRAGDADGTPPAILLHRGSTGVMPSLHSGGAALQGESPLPTSSLQRRLPATWMPLEYTVQRLLGASFQQDRAAVPSTVAPPATPQVRRRSVQPSAPVGSLPNISLPDVSSPPSPKGRGAQATLLERLVQRDFAHTRAAGIAQGPLSLVLPVRAPTLEPQRNASDEWSDEELRGDAQARPQSLRRTGWRGETSRADRSTAEPSRPRLVGREASTVAQRSIAREAHLPPRTAILSRTLAMLARDDTPQVAERAAFDRPRGPRDEQVPQRPMFALHRHPLRPARHPAQQIARSSFSPGGMGSASLALSTSTRAARTLSPVSNAWSGAAFTAAPANLRGFWPESSGAQGVVQAERRAGADAGTQPEQAMSFLSSQSDPERSLGSARPSFTPLDLPLRRLAAAFASPLTSSLSEAAGLVTPGLEAAAASLPVRTRHSQPSAQATRLRVAQLPARPTPAQPVRISTVLPSASLPALAQRVVGLVPQAGSPSPTSAPALATPASTSPPATVGAQTHTAAREANLVDQILGRDFSDLRRMSLDGSGGADSRTRLSRLPLAGQSSAVQLSPTRTAKESPTPGARRPRTRRQWMQHLRHDLLSAAISPGQDALSAPVSIGSSLPLPRLRRQEHRENAPESVARKSAAPRATTGANTFTAWTAPPVSAAWSAQWMGDDIAMVDPWRDSSGSAASPQGLISRTPAASYESLPQAPFARQFMLRHLDPSTSASALLTEGSSPLPVGSETVGASLRAGRAATIAPRRTRTSAAAPMSVESASTDRGPAQRAVMPLSATARGIRRQMVELPDLSRRVDEGGRSRRNQHSLSLPGQRDATVVVIAAQHARWPLGCCNVISAAPVARSWRRVRCQ